jgi:hypothetical protein
MSASNIAQKGPGPMPANSSTVMPLSVHIAFPQNCLGARFSAYDPDRHVYSARSSFGAKRIKSPFCSWEYERARPSCPSSHNTNTAIGAPTAAASGTTTDLTLATPFAATAQLYRGVPLLLSGDHSLVRGIIDYNAARVATLGESMATPGAVATLAQILTNVLYSPTSDEAIHHTATLYFYAAGLRWRCTGGHHRSRVQQCQ